jgi:hypothetical protein
MIYVTEEGADLKCGVHFYPWRDKSSFGLRVRFKKTLYRVRWSKLRKRFFCDRASLGEKE